ncbi:MAG: hypothetical protein DRI61_08185 [Chloroflexi bacterium]|nr:MAG: hypothetical protein DRI61_08185 [Chloroflexota bacterium]
MFVRTQKSGRRTYLLVVENEWVDGKVKQKVLHRLGRLDVLQQSGQLEGLMQSMQRFSEKLAVLTTNTELSAPELALKYKQLWMAEAIFRSMKSLLETRPIFHKCDATIRGHVFCSFLALLRCKELQDRLAHKGMTLEWADVIRELDSLVEMDLSVSGKPFTLAE